MRLESGWHFAPEGAGSSSLPPVLQGYEGFAKQKRDLATAERVNGTRLCFLSEKIFISRSLVDIFLFSEPSEPLEAEHRLGGT